jgi:hypothetical protein
MIKVGKFVKNVLQIFLTTKNNKGKGASFSIFFPAMNFVERLFIYSSFSFYQLQNFMKKI